MSAVQRKTPQPAAGAGESGVAAHAHDPIGGVHQQKADAPAGGEPGNAALNQGMATGEGEAPADPVAPVPAGPPGGGAAPAATTLTIRIQNEYDAGGAADRSTVGIAEKSYLDCGDMSGTWTASGGVGAMAANGLYAWSAPMTAGTYTITYRQGTDVGTVAFTVLAPSGFSGDAPTADAIASGQGAGMVLGVHMEPQTVAFNKLQWIEDVVPVSNKTGYFDGHGHNPTGHGVAQGAGRWLTMGNNNSTTDHASFAGWPGPWRDTSAAAAWSGGSYTWAISTKYRLGGSGSPVNFVTNDQVMTIDDGATGASTVSKFGQSTSRTP